MGGSPKYGENIVSWLAGWSKRIQVDNAVGANTDFDFNSDITENLSKYYGDQNWVCHRVYQQMV